MAVLPTQPAHVRPVRYSSHDPAGVRRPRSSPGHAPLAAVTRGDAIESLHAGSVAVVDRHGRLLHAAGDPAFPTMTRSALKPFQAMPFVAAGGIGRFGYSDAQVALLCASHSGEPRHVAAVADMLAKAGNSPGDLQCGTHAPRFHELRGEATPPPPYSPLAHNCSGKHSGMLAYCVHCGLPKESYLAYDHPLQQAIRRAVAHFTSTPESELVAGVDGCSAPNYAVRSTGLRSDSPGSPPATTMPCTGRAPQVLADAMTAHPEMVSGDGRSDLAADARGTRRLGGQDRRRRRAGRSASAVQASASRSRWRTATSARCGRSSRPSWSSCSWSTRDVARNSRIGSLRSSATTAELSPGGSCRPLSWTNSPSSSSPDARSDRNNPIPPMNFRFAPWSVDASAHRMVPRTRRPSRSGALWSLRPDAAPAVRRA